MDSEKCRILLKVIELGNMSLAADALGYTPSGVSRAMESLEQQTGFPLLVRSRTSCSLTREGEELLPMIRELVRWSDSCDGIASGIRGLECGTVQVGIAYDEFYPRLISTMTRFHKTYPGITVNITEGSSSELNELVSARKLDFAIISRRPSDRRWLELRKDELMAVLPPQHPLAQSGSVNINAFGTEDYIEILPGRETDNSRLFESCGIVPKVRFSTNSISAAFTMVENGFGIALANNLLCVENRERKVVTRHLDPPALVEIGVTVPDNDLLSPGARRFFEFAFESH